MRLSSAFALFASFQTVSGFVPFAPSRWINSPTIRSTVQGEETTVAEVDTVEQSMEEALRDEIIPLSEAEINARVSMQMKKLQAKDSSSTQLSKEDLQIVYEDDDLLVVDKQAGVLSVPGRIPNPSLAQAVFDAVGCEMGRMDMMVVHRLGMDTSGLMVFAKTMDALRGMNEVFRTRAIERKYEALVCGHIEKDAGFINLPLMRDYEFPPFMRISTNAHQHALLGLDADQLKMKKILDLPKESLTKYEVISREDLDGLPVTRVALTSMSGRTHQLNVHLAAFGHPIVGDATYGIDGDAASNGGLSEAEFETLVPNPSRASESLQRRIARTANGKMSCVHAKALTFRHPLSKDDLAFVCDAPF